MGAEESKRPREESESCGSIVKKRNRYFTGKFMTARDFQGEQGYFLSRHRLHNRLLHGWGIVCGLEVVPHNNPECQDRWVVVCPGIALDCCGRELVLEKKTPVKIWDPPEADAQDYPKLPQGQEQTSPEQYEKPPEPESREPCEPQDTRCFLVCLRYVEKPVEHTPALYAEGICDPSRREANGICEVAELEICTLDEVEGDCWRVSGGDEKTRCRDDCDDGLPGPAGTCLEPECPCGERVPLALICPSQKPDGGYWIGEDEIDTGGRRHLPVPSELLTHVAAINWTHGGDVTLSELRAMDGKLKVRFDRPLLQSSDKDRGFGINHFTFVVQYGGIQQDIEFLPYDLDHPPRLAEDRCTAVFTIDPDLLSEKARVSLANNFVYVSLKCDFILDCHETPVDGNHLRGRLPSGNGTPGGVFESWFRVAPDTEAKE